MFFHIFYDVSVIFLLVNQALINNIIMRFIMKVGGVQCDYSRAIEE